MKSVALLKAQLQHTARVDLVMRCYLNSAETTSASVALEDLMLLVPMTCFYCYQGLRISFVLYHLMFRSRITDHRPVSRKSRNLFGPEKPFVKLGPVYSVKLLFSYNEKGMKMETTAKFRASRRLRFADTKRIMSPEMSPKSFGTFEKQAPCLERRLVSVALPDFYFYWTL